MRAAVLALACCAAGAATGAPAVSMDPQQSYLFQHAYPGAEVIFDCEGNFSGASDHEHVLGVRRAGQPVRVGLLFDSGKWLFHDIERELRADKLPPRRWIQDWDAQRAGDPKCKADLQRDADLAIEGKPHDKPLFPLRAGQATACFGTSEQYNNWDCLAYRNGRFRFWYQQVFAD